MIEARSNYTDGCWSAGNLSYLLRPHGQTKFYDFVKSHVYGKEKSIRPIVGNMHRRKGKSYGSMIMCLERCLERPGQMVKYAAATDKDVQEIAVPHLNELLSVKPPFIKYEKNRHEHRFWNPNWGVSEKNKSLLHLIGLNAEKGDRLRGRACDFGVLDEVRNVNNLRYVFESVLAYQFVGRDNPGIVMVTTPPDSMDHEYVSYFVPNAKQHGRYQCITVDDNPDFTEDDRRMVIEAVRGGEGSIPWRREALCEFLSDPEMLITPEMSIESVQKGVLVPEYERPPFFIPTVVLDGAYRQDKLAIIFGYIDFPNQRLVVEDSYIDRELTTKEIQSVILRYEHMLGYDKNPHRVRRKGDLTAQQIADLNIDYKLRIQNVENKDPESTIAELRSQLSTHRIKILTERNGRPVNQALIHQLLHGVYTETRSDYARTESMGHWDGGQGLAYMVKVAPWRENPFLQRLLFGPNVFVPRSQLKNQPQGALGKVLAALSAPPNPYMN